MTGSAISGLAVTMSAADTRFTSIANIARENHYGSSILFAFDAIFLFFTENYLISYSEKNV